MDTSSSTPPKNLFDRILAFIESLPIGDRFLLRATSAVFLVALGAVLFAANSASLVSIPGAGGTLREGIVGTPRFINPVLAVTNADQDLTALVHAGLYAVGGDGTIIPNIAASMTVSDDGLVYNVQLRNDVLFHDGTPLDADDVIFTVEKIQDPMLKSPLRASWEGVLVERLGDYEVNFVLPEPYAPFIENLTVGILPKHIWEHATVEEIPFSQYNSEPVGAGPYEVVKIMRDDSGIPSSYELRPFDDYFGGSAKLGNIVLTFFPTEEALVSAFARGDIESAGGLSHTSLAMLSEANIPYTLHTTPLPRTFALFFNQNELPAFRDRAARAALEAAVDRDLIVKDVLGGYGIPIETPIPPGFGVPSATSATSSDIAALDEARTILRDGGWRWNETSSLWEKTSSGETLSLSFSISTANTSVFGRTAELLAERWGKLGVPVTIRKFEQSDLTQTVIRPRDYEALLFGTVVGRELDFFSFWHSSQRNDPGLNVALYASISADALLSEARTTADTEKRVTLHEAFAEEIATDVPAIFLYVPFYTYATAPRIEGISLSGIARGSERLRNAYQWHTEKERVWPFFAK